MKRFGLFAAAVCLLIGGMAQAQVTLLDQIGPDASGVNGQNASASQNFEAANAAFNVAVGDNFTVPAGPAVKLNSVASVLLGFTGFVAANYTNGSVQNYQVNIYGAPTNAQTNLVGNIASFTTTGLTGVTTVSPFGTDALRALITIDLNAANINLAAGTYWVSVIPRMDFTPGGQLGVSLSTFGGGGGDGFQANPGGGFGLPANLATNVGNFAYRLVGTPVPEPTSMALVGLGTIGFAVRRWRKK